VEGTAQSPEHHRDRGCSSFRGASLSDADRSNSGLVGPTTTVTLVPGMQRLRIVKLTSSCPFGTGVEGEVLYVPCDGSAASGNEDVGCAGHKNRKGP